MKRVVATALGALVFLCGSVRAEPGPVVSYLMSQPASVFTIGMMRLERRLTQLGSRVGAGYFASYDWEKNRIEVSSIDFDSVQAPQERCRALISAVRSDAGVDMDTGNFLGKLKNSYYADLFSQIGFKKKTDPEDLARQVDTIIVIDASVFGRDGTSASCEGPLVSNRILIEEQAPSNAKARQSNSPTQRK
jgi:hypothetical protein